MNTGKRDIIILGALVGNEHMSDTGENDWIQIDMAEAGKFQILRTNWNQAQTFADAKSLCDSKGGMLWWDRKKSFRTFLRIMSPTNPFFKIRLGTRFFVLISI